MQPRVSLIFPAYNEAERIENTIRETAEFFRKRELSHEIIVAADGDDNTREIVRGMAAGDPAIRVIGQRERRGKGRGIREAVAIANGEIVGYADADNKVPIEEFNKIEPWLRDGFEVVTGCRASAEAEIECRQPLYRRIGATGFRVFMHTVVGLRDVQDTQCGFKFFPAKVAKRLFEAQRIDGYMFDVEILALAARWGYRIKSVPIRWRDDGDSRLDLVAGNVRNVID
ncbi:MAG: glycosyltransferase family 2 protein, partial [bacterium]|nr:glycosyltransferase family 2 protein [bacterium]